MFSFLKKYSAVCIILSVVCSVAAVLCLMMIATIEGVDRIMMICAAAFVGSLAVIALILSFTLWGLANELSFHVDSNLDDISKLKKRIEALEKR